HRNGLERRVSLVGTRGRDVNCDPGRPGCGPLPRCERQPHQSDRSFAGKGLIMNKWVVIFLFVLPVSGCRSEAQVATGSTVTFGPDLVVDNGPLERLIVVDGNLYSPATEPVVIQRIRWYWDYN